MRCDKHGPVEPCDGRDNEHYPPKCDPSIPHCPRCGRQLRS